MHLLHHHALCRCHASLLVDALRQLVRAANLGLDQPLERRAHCLLLCLVRSKPLRKPLTRLTLQGNASLQRLHLLLHTLLTLLEVGDLDLDGHHVTHLTGHRAAWGGRVVKWPYSVRREVAVLRHDVYPLG